MRNYVYVKTKDGIYEVDDEIGVDCDTPYYRVFGKDYDLPFEEIVDRADTIEELCDEFVMVSELEKKPYVTKGGYKGICGGFEHIKECGRKASFYGAIWVTGSRGEPILKPVAKMNDKGELEFVMKYQEEKAQAKAQRKAAMEKTTLRPATALISAWSFGDMGIGSNKNKRKKPQMSYVKTKDGKIYEVEKRFPEYGNKDSVVVVIDNRLVDLNAMGMVEKQDDEIYKLFDCCVYIVDGFLPSLVEFKEPESELPYFECVDNENTSWDIEWALTHGKVYGAILTASGIKYAAELNKQGEWDLL